MNEINELYLFASNNEDIYKLTNDIKKGINKKIEKNIFDKEKAIKAFYRVATEAAKLYCKYFGGCYYQVFNVKIRTEVAKIFVENLNED